MKWTGNDWGMKKCAPHHHQFSNISLIIPRIYFHGSNKTGFKKSKTFSPALENLCVHEKRQILFICSRLAVFVQFVALCSCVIPFGVSCLSSCLLVFHALSSCITITLFTLYPLPLQTDLFLVFREGSVKTQVQTSLYRRSSLSTTLLQSHNRSWDSWNSLFFRKL